MFGYFLQSNPNPHAPNIKKQADLFKESQKFKEYHLLFKTELFSYHLQPSL
jgi:hypothetical protein